MQYRYRQVREDLGWRRAEMAQKMGVDVTSAGNWENGNRQMTLEKLLLMAAVTGYPIQYLLGFDDPQVGWTKPIPPKALSVMHRSPVWTSTYGWGLINNIEYVLVFADLKTISLDIVQEPIYALPPI